MVGRCFRQVLALGMAVALSVTPALALSGFEVVSGNVTLEENGNVVNITSHSNQAIIHFETFNITNGQTVNFLLPGSGSSILNRILGGSASYIDGNLFSNGQVFLYNPAGINIGQTANINAALFYASSLNITNQNFLTGNYTFYRDMAYTIDGNGAIENKGNIQAAITGLLGSVVSNSGSITGEHIHMAAGDKIVVNFSPSMTFEVTVDEGLQQDLAEAMTLVSNTGTIEGNDIGILARIENSIYQGLVSNEGVIRAQGVTIDTAGQIHITGENVRVANYGTLDASGDTGGGIYLASNQGIIHTGTMTAQGITQGGEIELTGGGSLDLFGAMNASSSQGQGGSVYLQSNGVMTASTGNIIDVSGQQAGSIFADVAGTFSSGKYLAVSGNGVGGNIDFAGNVSFLGATADASGLLGGGRIRLGGEYQGGQDLAVDEIANGQSVVISQNTLLKAATLGTDGDGGTTIVWSDGSTHFYGDIDVRPGSVSGAGGFAEVSGHDLHITEGNILTGVDTRQGSVLLDPKNIYIQNGPLQGLSLLKLADNGAIAGFGLADSDNFGSGIALNGTGNILAVGALGDATASPPNLQGAVYLFNVNPADPSVTPTLGFKITNATVPGLGVGNIDQFGFSVALSNSGSILAVGANQDNTGGADRGAVYLLELNPANLGQVPTLEYKITHGNVAGLNLANGDNFGSSVALNNSGNILAVGAQGDDTGGGAGNQGAAYLFNLNTADLTQAPTLGFKIADNGGVAGFNLLDGDAFGSSIALNGAGNILAVGANLDDTGGGARGAAYLFEVNTSNTSLAPTRNFKLAHGLIPGFALANGNRFGSGIALNDSGSILAVGTPADSIGCAVCGATYLFNINPADTTQTPVLSLKLNSGAVAGFTLNVGDSFGSSVALNGAGNLLAVGASLDDTGGGLGANRGSAYLFRLGELNFGNLPNGDFTLSPDFLETLLNTGQTVNLMANNDIFVNAAINVNNAFGDGGNLILRAGRSVLINSSITTDNGDLSISGNNQTITGVQNASRDPGNAVITQAGAAPINAGTGEVKIQLGNGAGLTNNASGDIILSAVTGGPVSVITSASGSDLILNGPVSIITSATGVIITLGGSLLDNGNASNKIQANNGNINITVGGTVGTNVQAFQGVTALNGTVVVAGGTQIGGVSVNIDNRFVPTAIAPVDTLVHYGTSPGLVMYNGLVVAATIIPGPPIPPGIPGILTRNNDPDAQRNRSNNTLAWAVGSKKSDPKIICDNSPGKPCPVNTDGIERVDSATQRGETLELSDKPVKKKKPFVGALPRY